MAKPTNPPTARIIDTLSWEAILSVVSVLDKSSNSDVQHFISDLVAEVRTKLFQELPLVQEEPKEAQRGKVLSFDPGPQKPN